jgi:TolB protein
MFLVALLVHAQTTPGADAPPALRRLTHSVNAYACFAPDGRSLVYQSSAGGKFDLHVIQFDGSGGRVLVDDPANDEMPVYSPDGKSIAFLSDRTGNRDLFVMNADGTNVRNVTNNPAVDFHMAWSADGKRILFSSNRGNADVWDHDIYEMAADGSDLRQLTSGPYTDTYASWSPDGMQIVSRRMIDGNSEVFLFDRDGTNPRNLTSSPAYDGWPMWSPDGKKIAFCSGPPDENQCVYLMNADGTGRVQLTAPAPGSDFCYDTQPAFSRDGRWLAFTRYRPFGEYESSEICIYDLERANR